MRFLFSFLAMLAITVRLHAVNIVYQVYNEGVDAGDHGSTSGSDNEQCTVRFFIPNGSADGNYTLRTTQYGSVFSVTVSGGVSNYPDVTHSRILVFSATDIVSYYSGASVTLYIVKPDGTNTANQVITGFIPPVIYSSSIATQSAYPGGRFRTTEKGPLDMSTAAVYVPKTATLKVKVLNLDNHAHTLQFVVNGTVVATQSLAARAVGSAGVVSVNTFSGTLNETTAPNGTGWGVTIDNIAASAVEGGQIAYGDPPADYVPIFPPQITIQQSTPAGSLTTNPTAGAANDTTTPPPTNPVPTTPPPASPNTTVANGGSAPTTQDIYEAVKAALNDSLDMQEPHDGPPAGDLDNHDSDLANRGHLDDVQGQIDDLVSSAQAHKDARISKLNFDTQLAGVPRGDLGSVSTLDFGTVTLVGGATYHVQIDLTPYLSTLALIRTALLWLMRLCFIYKCITAVVDGL